jgi:NDP-sugar pyrophosphorylase family protein
MKAMIFTAGIEGIMAPRRSGEPKALARINNEPLLGILISRLAESGFREIIVNVNHFAEQIIRYLRENNNFNITIEISDETLVRLNRGGGIKGKEWFFNDNKPFLVYCLEILSDLDLQDLYHHHTRSGALATLAVRRRESTKFMIFNEEMHLCGWENTETGETRMVREIKSEARRFAFSRIQVVNPEIFSLLEEEWSFPMAEIYLRLAEKYTIRGYPENESIWMDLGKSEGIIEAEKLFLKN